MPPLWQVIRDEERPFRQGRSWPSLLANVDGLLLLPEQPCRLEGMCRRVQNSVTSFLFRAFCNLLQKIEVTCCQALAPHGCAWHLAQDDPHGLWWSYSGSGPAQLALAILLEYWPVKAAVTYYQAFKLAFIAALPPADFEMTVALRKIMTRQIETIL